MTRLVVRDLAPGTTYYMQVREITPDSQSAWSPRLMVQTQQDNSEPAAPTGVQWIPVGRAFSAAWVAPTTLVSGEPLNNLSHYEVRVGHTASGQSKTWDVSAKTFDLSFEMNETAFAGARSPLTFEVRTVTNTGRTSLWTSPVTATNPVPAPVTSLVTIDAVEAIGLKWTGAADLDLVGYNIYASQTNGFSPSGVNKVATVNTTLYTHYSTSASPWYFHVRSVDIFGQESSSSQVTGTAKGAPGADTTPPAGPTSVTVAKGFDDARQQAYVTVSWVASADTDVRSYSVRYSPGAAGNWNYVVTPGDVTSVRIDVASGTAIYTAVQAIDFSNNKSAFVNASTYPITTDADTSVPSTPSTPTAVGNTMQVQVTHDNLKAAGGAMEADVAYYDVYASKTSGFTTYNTTTYIGKVIKSLVTSETFPLPVTGSALADTWYVKVKAVDRAGNASAASAQASVVPALIANTNIVDATITTAKIVSLVADKITAGAGIIADLTIGRSADALGSIKSYGYVASSTGFKLDKTQLEINDGTIKARALELRNGGNLMPPIYTDFEGAVKSYDEFSGNPAKIFPTNATWEIIGVGGKFGDQGLRVSTLGGGSTGGVSLSPVIGNQTYNVNVEGLREYIVSAYLRSNDTSAPNVRFAIFYDDGTSDTTHTGSTVTANYTRYWDTFTVPVTATSCYIKIYSGATTAVTFDVDGVQVEERIGKLTTPSQWLPSSSTSIDGGQIKTGAMQSNSTIFVNNMEVPAWYIDLNGRAQFSDASVLGALNIGTETENQGASYAQSRNYSADLLQGWRIDSAGKAFFNDANIRGEFTATSAEIIGRLSVTGTGTIPAAVDFGNSTTATLANAVSSPPGTPTILPIDWSLTNIPAAVEQTDLYGRMHGPAVNSAGDYTYVTMQNNAGNIQATFVKSTNAGVLISSTTTTITTWDQYDPTAYMVGFTCYDGTNYSIQFRKSIYDNTYYNATFSNVYALTANTALNLTDEFSPTLWGSNEPYMEHIGSDLWVARCRNNNVRVNLVRNPTMSNSDPDKFFRGYYGASVHRDTTGNTHGTYALRVTATTSQIYKGFEVFSEGESGSYDERPCTPGDYIYYTLDVRASSDISSPQFQTGIYYNNGAFVERTEFESISTSTSGTRSGYFIVPEGAHHFKFVFRIQRSDGGTISAGKNVMYVDALRVTNNGPKPYVGTFGYADGSTTDWYWDGTANDAESTAGVPAGTLIVRKFALGSEGLGFTEYNEDSSVYVGQSIAGLKVDSGDFGSGTFAAVTTDQYTGSQTHNSNWFVMNLTSDAIFEYTQVPFGTIGTRAGRYYVLDRSRTKLALLERTFMGHYLNETVVGSNNNITHTKVNFGYTYYDPDATGGTHETPLGPVIAWDASGQHRKPWRISNVKIPSVPAGVSATDRPTQIGLYASYGSDRQGRTYMNRIAFYTPTADGIVSSPITLTTNILGNTGVTGNMNLNNPLIVNTAGTAPNQAPSSNQFLGIAGFVPAVLQSQALNALGSPLIKLGGDGAAEIAAMKWTTSGIILSADAGVPAGNLKTSTGGYELYHDGTGKWPSLKARPQVHYFMNAIQTFNNVNNNITKWEENTTHSNNQGFFTMTSQTTMAVTVAGYYRVGATIKTGSNAPANIDYKIRIVRNGSTVIDQNTRAASGGTVNVTGTPRILLCAAGDQFVVTLSHDDDSSPPSLNIDIASGSTYLTAEYLGPA